MSKKTDRKTPPLSLRSWLFVLLSTVLVLPTLLWGLVYSVGLSNVSRGIILENLKQRGESHAEALARELYLPWQHVSYLATRLDPGEPETVRNMLTAMVAADRRYLWLGVAVTDGRIVAASSGFDEGQNVNGKRWFEAGLQEPFTGEPHAHDALAELLPPRSEDYQFFDFAAPIRNAEGRVVGVLSAKLDWNYFKSSLARLLGNQLETLLIDRNGQVLIGPDNLAGQRLSADNAIAQTQAEPSLRMSTWRDGVTYVSVTIPGVTYADLPSAGFSLIVRQRAEQAFQPLHVLIRHFWQAVALGAAMVLPFIIGLSWWIAKPISRFAQFARDLADGQTGPPPEHHEYREAEQLSAALARLQCRMGALDAQQHDDPEIQALGSVRNDRSPPQYEALS
jgi:hypothetical protein